MRRPVFVLLLFLLLPAAAFVPWTQTVPGRGQTIAFHPARRPQFIVSPIEGRVKKWHVVEGDRVQGVLAQIYAGHRGYDDGDNHYYLECHGLHSALKLKRQRTEKKNANQEVWLELQAKPEYEAGQKERCKKASWIISWLQIT